MATAARTGRGSSHAYALKRCVGWLVPAQQLALVAMPEVCWRVAAIVFVHHLQLFGLFAISFITSAWHIVMYYIVSIRRTFVQQDMQV
jgi:hypothetical protein